MIIFDDFHKVKDEKISIFLKYLKERSKNKILVLTRSKPPFYLDDIHSKELVLHGLQLEDARKMISQLGLEVDENTVAEQWRRFGGHPMTLKIFSLFAKAKHMSFNSNNQSIGAIDSINDYFQKEILEILSSDEQNILLTLSVFRTPVKSKAFKGININQRNLVFLLHSLEKKMIISRTASDKFLVHDMLRDILYPMLTYPEDAHASAALYYLSEAGAENVVESLYHFTKCQDTESILRVLQEEVIDEKYRIIEDGYAGPFLDILSHINLQNTNRNQLGYFYNVKGKALSMLQRWDEAKENLEKTVKLSENASDDRLLAFSLRNYGESLYLHGDLNGAEKRLLRAAEIFSKTNGTLRALRSTYVMIARLYFATGRPEESKTYSDMAASISVV
jgi:ATP/maltotriose-dependent transcriptional regulator MalT